MPTQLKTSIEAAALPAPEQPAPRPRTPYTVLEEASSLYVGLYTRVLALRELVEELARTITGSFVVDSGGRDGHVGNARAAAYRFFDHERISRLVAMQGVLKMIEASSDFRTAEAAIKPLLDDIHKFEVAQEAERVLAGERAVALNSALEAAKTKALEAVERDPNVLAARRALEK